MQIYPPFMTRVDSRFFRALALVLPIVLVALTLSRNVNAKTTYVITDGDQVITHSSYATDPEAVLDEAGLELSELDVYTTQQSDGVSEITVQRSQQITIDNCGEIILATSYGETVGQLLQRLEISSNGAYEVSVPVDTATYDGMEIDVRWHFTDRQTYTEEIPFAVSYCDDPTLDEGEQKILTPGVNGQMLCAADVVYDNGVEVSRTLVEQTVTLEPVTQVVAVGTGAGYEKPADQLQIGNGYIVLATGEVLTYTHTDVYKATAYTSWIDDVGDTTATGTLARVGAIAVDPKLIPYGTRMFIVTNDGQYVYGIATAEDCGGGVKGKHVDLFFDTEGECWQFGVRQITIYFLGDADRRGPQNR